MRKQFPHREKREALLAIRYRLIEAAEIGTVVPVRNERVARELAPLRSEPVELREAWSETVDVHYSSQTGEWATPQDLFDTLPVVAERDENICRRDMAPSEKVALGRELETLERPRAEERRLEGNRRGGEVAETFSATSGSVEKGRVRHIVGEAVGMSGPTYPVAVTVTTTTVTER